MSREWISDKDQRWQMRCDEDGCSTRSEPFDRQPPLELFAERGWFIAAKYGDVCPSCRGRVITRGRTPHGVMKAVAVSP